MTKPEDILLKLYAFGDIHGMRLRMEHDGFGRESWTFWILMGTNHDGRLKAPKPIEMEITEAQGRSYLHVCPGDRFIAHIKDPWVEQVEEWKKFIKQNKRDLAEFARLKEKLNL